MPKALSITEKEGIRQRLRQAAEDCIALTGLRKTTVDALVQRAKIPKGTFYLLYSSKEELLFEIVELWHAEMQAQFLANVRAHGASLTADALAQEIVTLCLRPDVLQLMELFDSGEIELLLAKLPPEKIAAHIQSDAMQMEGLLKALPAANTAEAQRYAAAFRAVFMTTLHRRAIGEEYPQALYLLVRGLTAQMLGEDKPI